MKEKVSAQNTMILIHDRSKTHVGRWLNTNGPGQVSIEGPVCSGAPAKENDRRWTHRTKKHITDDQGDRAVQWESA